MSGQRGLPSLPSMRALLSNLLPQVITDLGKGSKQKGGGSMVFYHTWGSEEEMLKDHTLPLFFVVPYVREDSCTRFDEFFGP